MTDDTAALDRLLARLAVEGYRLEDPDEHPIAEKLSAYQANELSTEENDAIQEHVTNCSLCAERLLDLGRFLDPPLEDRQVKGVADFEAAAECRELRQRMKEERLQGSLRAVRSLAAVLGILLVGISLYAVRLHSHLPHVRPIPETTLDFLQKRGNDLEKIEARLPMALKLLVDADYPRYKVEIRSDRGSLLYSYDGYRRADVGRLALPLPDGFLAPGTYAVGLFGLRDGQSESIGSPIKLIILP